MRRLKDSNVSEIKQYVNIFKYCPVCNCKLRKRETVDSFIHSITCKNNHYFYIPLDPTYNQILGNKYKKLRVESDDKIATAKNWLKNPKLRMHLDTRLAEILRIYLEVETKNYVFQNEEKYKSCPICGEFMGIYEIGSWCVYYKCKNNHSFQQRTGFNYSVTKDLSIYLHRDMSYKTLLRSTINWLTDYRYDQHLPTQVRELLVYFYNKLITSKPYEPEETPTDS